MCRYLVVRPDDSFSRTVATPVVAAFLATLPTLRRTSPTAPYQGVGVQVLLVHCDPAGNYSMFADQPAPAGINRIELICSCHGPQRYRDWESLAGLIAEHLDWEVVDDETDEVLRPRPGTRH